MVKSGKSKLLWSVVILGCLAIESPMFSQWFDPQTINCIVLIEKSTGSSYYPHGTGFFVRLGATPTSHAIITARHLLNSNKIYASIPIHDDFKAFATAHGLKSLSVEKRIWYIKQDRLRTEVELSLNGKKRFVVHPNSSVDVAAFRLDSPGWVRIEDDSVRMTNTQVMTTAYIAENTRASLGSDAYFLGFPMGFGASDPISPVLRSGSIAWVGESGSEFWLDALSFGGNSGGPVFAKARIGPRVGVIRPEGSSLIGMIFGHYGLEIPILQADTSRRAVVQNVREVENLGLVRVVPADAILEVVRLAQKTFTGNQREKK